MCNRVDMIFAWNEDKNRQLLAERGVSFEMAVAKIAKGEIVDRYRHPNHEKYPGQFIFVLELNDYFYCLPFVKQGETYFLKTLFPSRKAAKIYQGKHHDQPQSDSAR